MWIRSRKINHQPLRWIRNDKEKLLLIYRCLQNTQYQGEKATHQNVNPLTSRTFNRWFSFVLHNLPYTSLSLQYPWITFIVREIIILQVTDLVHGFQQRPTKKKHNTQNKNPNKSQIQWPWYWPPTRGALGVRKFRSVTARGSGPPWKAIWKGWQIRQYSWVLLALTLCESLTKGVDVCKTLWPCHEAGTQQQLRVRMSDSTACGGGKASWRQTLPHTVHQLHGQECLPHWALLLDRAVNISVFLGIKASLSLSSFAFTVWKQNLTICKQMSLAVSIKRFFVCLLLLLFHKNRCYKNMGRTADSLVCKFPRKTHTCVSTNAYYGIMGLLVIFRG